MNNCEKKDPDLCATVVRLDESVKNIKDSIVEIKDRLDLLEEQNSKRYEDEYNLVISTRDEINKVDQKIDSLKEDKSNTLIRRLKYVIIGMIGIVAFLIGIKAENILEYLIKTLIM